MVGSHWIHGYPSPAAAERMYRLTDGHGLPHPVLDECFDSLDAAHEAALDWIDRQSLLSAEAPPAERHALVCLHFGLEVSTPSGDWRTLRHPGLPPAATPLSAAC